MRLSTLPALLLAFAYVCGSPSNKVDNVGTFWHVSDLHLDFYYDASATDLAQVCPSSSEANAFNPGQWGDYRCDSPWDLVHSSIYAMKNIKNDPDFIIWTGDDTLHTSNEEKWLSEELVIDTIRNLTNLIKEAFPNTIVHSAIGNHDYHPKNQIPTGPNHILQNIADMWQDWMTPEQLHVFNTSGYYSVLPEEFPSTYIISLNSNLWYTSNKLSSGTGDPADQFAWLSQVLTDARNNNKKAYIIGHIPPGYFELVDYKPWFHEEYNQRYNALVRQFSDVIIGQFFGHHHTDTFRMFKDESDNPVSALWVTPGVTPWMTTLPGVSDGANNPGIRLFEFDRTTMMPLDYRQYMLDLEQANTVGAANWVLEYRATEAYGIPDLKPNSMNSLLEVMTSANTSCTDCVENRVMQKFALFNSVSYNKQYCNATCQRLHVCSVAHVDYEPYLKCVNGFSSLHKRGFLCGWSLFIVLLSIVVYS